MNDAANIKDIQQNHVREKLISAVHLFGLGRGYALDSHAYDVQFSEAEGLVFAKIVAAKNLKPSIQNAVTECAQEFEQLRSNLQSAPDSLAAAATTADNGAGFCAPSLNELSALARDLEKWISPPAPGREM